MNGTVRIGNKSAILNIQRAEAEFLVYKRAFSVAFSASLFLLIAVIAFLTLALYIPFFVVLGLASVSLYFSVFLYFAFFDRKTLLRLFALLQNATGTDIASLAAAMKWKKKETSQFIKRCEARGYIEYR